MTRRNAYARIEQISIQASGCKWVRIVAQMGARRRATVGNGFELLQVNYTTRRVIL